MRRAALILTSVLVLFMTAQGEAAGIWNGNADNGRHPYAGAVGIWASDEERPEDFLGFCSASLLSPTLVLTAAHCTVGGHHAYFTADEEVNDPNVTVYRGTPFTYPGFCQRNCGPGRLNSFPGDVGVIVLDKPVPAADVSTFAALPPAGLVDTLPNKTPLELVGYGVEFKCKNSDPHPRWFLCGGDRKRVATSELVSGEFTSSDVHLRLATNPGGDSGGVCSGDSGGPNLKGGSNVVLAVTSWGNNLNCMGVGYGARIDNSEILAWINGYLDEE